MPVKYKLYIVEEDRKTYAEKFYTRRELEKYKIDPDEYTDLWECAERMVHEFNRTIDPQRPQNKRYAYKLEKVAVTVVGSEAYYGLNISGDMCEPEF